MWILYTILTLLQTLLLLFGGMNLFDGICHAFTTMATGGFSTKQNSIAYWDSAYIQYVIIIFTFMAGTNFGLLHTAIRGNWRKLIQDNEFQLYFTIVLLASVVIGVGLYVIGWADFEKSMRDATFQVVTLNHDNGICNRRLSALASLVRFDSVLTSFRRSLSRFYSRRNESRTGLSAI